MAVVSIELNVGLEVGEAYRQHDGEKIAHETAYRAIALIVEKEFFMNPYATGDYLKAQHLFKKEAVGIYEDMFVFKISGHFAAGSVTRILQAIENVCEELKQEAIAVQVSGCGGLLVGKHRFKAAWGHGVFNPEFFKTYEWAYNYNNA